MKALGYFILSIPFVVIFIYVIIDSGWIVLAKIIGIIIAIVLPLMIGINLTEGRRWNCFWW